MSKAELPVVVILDSNANRRRKMVDAFKGLARVQVVYDPSAPVKDSSSVIMKTAEGTSLSSVGPALVALRHVSEPHLTPHLNAFMTVYYGGNGSSDPKFPADAQEKIVRSVNPGAGTLTPDEARNLLNYSADKKAGTKATARPAFMVEVPSYEILPALSILCQGYLVVFAEQNSGSYSGPPATLKPAFRLMGWSEAVRNCPILSSTRRKIAEGNVHVREGNWWLKVFDVLDERAGVSEKKLAKFIERLRNEWGQPDGGKLPDEVERLPRLLATESKLDFTEENVELVAQVYCLITSKLSGNSPLDASPSY